MEDTSKTLYVWDLAGTLFQEIWDARKTGFPTIDAWMENRFGKKANEISDREWEDAHEELYKEGWHYQLDIVPGFEEVLLWAKNNEGFSSGTLEQLDCRAQYLNPRLGFDIKKYFQKINSTFEYEETNKKTREIYQKYLKKKYNEGYRTVVYSEDKIKYCEEFIVAAKKISQKYPDFSYRVYHVLNNDSEVEGKDYFFTAGNLEEIMKNEQRIRN